MEPVSSKFHRAFEHKVPATKQAGFFDNGIYKGSTKTLSPIFWPYRLVIKSCLKVAFSMIIVLKSHDTAITYNYHNSPIPNSLLQRCPSNEPESISLYIGDGLNST